MNLSMPKWFLLYLSSSEKCSPALVTYKTIFNMEAFSHMKFTMTTMRTNEPNRYIQFRHLPSPDSSKLYCIRLYHYAWSKIYNGIWEATLLRTKGNSICRITIIIGGVLCLSCLCSPLYYWVMGD